MRRRSIGGSKRAKAPRRKAAARKSRGLPDAASPASSAAAKETTVARLTRQLNEAYQQQTATAEVLKVISRSTFDLQTVLHTLVEAAALLCEADLANIWRPSGASYRLAASFGIPGKDREWRANKAYLESVEIEPGRGSIVGRVLLEKRPVQIHDVQTDPDYLLSKIISIGDYRTLLGVPLMREGKPIGVFGLTRCTVQPFTGKQIELVSTFADQAVIAIENARLFEEVQARTHDLTESLEQQTATSEVLKVISSSPGELQPVFDTMLQKAVRICEAKFGNLFLIDGETAHWAAGVGTPPDLAQFFTRSSWFRPTPDSHLDRVMRTKQVSHSADDTVEAVVGISARLGGARSTLCVPMVKDDALVGAIFIYRTEVRPFTLKQIDLLKSFADQAVIAIENARLLTEQREALEQQTATAEVLEVINSSPGKLAPVFQAILEKAHGLCAVSDGSLQLYDGNRFQAVAVHGLSEAFEERLRQGYVPGPNHPSQKLLQGERFAHVPDIGEIDDPISSDAFELGGVRTVLFLPLRKDGRLVGQIIAAQREVRTFSEKEIALLENFAAQAVIAMENAQLLDELRQSLRQQTATADVLKIITRSTFDLQAVLDTLVQSATQLCEAQDALIFLPSGKVCRAVARYGYSREYHKFIEANPISIDRGSVVGRTVIDRQRVHIADVLADPDYTRHDAQRLAGYRTALGVPLLREGEVVGAIFLTRIKPQPFTEKQIDLVTTFADQAVIAIENARLFNEVQQRTNDLSESLQQQTATADVLKVISRSTFDLQKVFDALTESACRVCGAYDAGLFLRAGEFLRNHSHHGPIPIDFDKAQISRDWVTGRSLVDRKSVHVHDLLVESSEFPVGNEMARRMGHRTILAMPLLREGESIGAIVLRRIEVHPFSEKQIALLQTFADQAVIAIENARLFDEVQARTRDLQESLQQQTATSEVLEIISSSPGDLTSVFESMLANATRVCGANFGQMNLYEEGSFRPVAHYNVPAAYAASLHTPFRPHPQSGLGTVARTRQLIHIEDIRTLPP